MSAATSAGVSARLDSFASIGDALRLLQCALGQPLNLDESESLVAVLGAAIVLIGSSPDYRELFAIAMTALEDARVKVVAHHAARDRITGAREREGTMPS